MAKFPRPPDQDNFSVTRGASTISVQLHGGAPRVRKDQIGTYSRVSCQWTCGREEYTEIQDFFDITLDEGSLPFTIDLYMKTGMQLTEHKAFFVPGTFKLAEQRGHTFIVQAELDANPTPIPPP